MSAKQYSQQYLVSKNGKCGYRLNVNLNEGPHYICCFNLDH